MPYRNRMILSALRVLISVADGCEPQGIDIRRIRSASSALPHASLMDAAKFVLDREMGKRKRASGGGRVFTASGD